METRVCIGLILSNRITKKQSGEFGFLLGLGFPIIIGWVIPSIGGHFF